MKAYRRLVIGVVASLILASGGKHAWAAPPKVKSSDPSNGANNVDPKLGAIRIDFDVLMKTDRHSVSPAAIKDTEMPKLVPDVQSKLFISPTTFVMLVSLAPNTDYAFGLNTNAKADGFQAADGTPLPATVIRFRTGRTRYPELAANCHAGVIRSIVTEFRNRRRGESEQQARIFAEVRKRYPGVNISDNYNLVAVAPSVQALLDTYFDDAGGWSPNSGPPTCAKCGAPMLVENPKDAPAFWKCSKGLSGCPTRLYAFTDWKPLTAEDVPASVIKTLDQYTRDGKLVVLAFTPLPWQPRGGPHSFYYPITGTENLFAHTAILEVAGDERPFARNVIGRSNTEVQLRNVSPASELTQSLKDALGGEIQYWFPLKRLNEFRRLPSSTLVEMAVCGEAGCLMDKSKNNLGIEPYAYMPLERRQFAWQSVRIYVERAGGRPNDPLVGPLPVDRKLFVLEPYLRITDHGVAGDKYLRTFPLGKVDLFSMYNLELKYFDLKQLSDRRNQSSGFTTLPTLKKYYDPKLKKYVDDYIPYPDWYLVRFTCNDQIRYGYKSGNDGRWIGNGIVHGLKPGRHVAHVDITTAGGHELHDAFVIEVFPARQVDIDDLKRDRKTEKELRATFESEKNRLAEARKQLAQARKPQERQQAERSVEDAKRRVWSSGQALSTTLGSVALNHLRATGGLDTEVLPLYEQRFALSQHLLEKCGVPKGSEPTFQNAELMRLSGMVSDLRGLGLRAIGSDRAKGLAWTIVDYVVDHNDRLDQNGKAELARAYGELAHLVISATNDTAKAREFLDKSLIWGKASGKPVNVSGGILNVSPVGLPQLLAKDPVGKRDRDILAEQRLREAK